MIYKMMHKSAKSTISSHTKRMNELIQEKGLPGLEASRRAFSEIIGATFKRIEEKKTGGKLLWGTK